MEAVLGVWGKGVPAEGLNLGSSGSVREGGSCEVSASLCFRSLCLWFCASSARSAPDFAPCFSALGSAVGTRGLGSGQKRGSCIQLKPSLQPLPSHRALRWSGGGLSEPQGGVDLGSTPRTRWYCPPPSQVRGAEGGSGPGDNGWGLEVLWDSLPLLAPPGFCVSLGRGGGWCDLYCHKPPVQTS